MANHHNLDVAVSYTITLASNEQKHQQFKWWTQNYPDLRIIIVLTIPSGKKHIISKSWHSNICQKSKLPPAI